MRVREPLGEAGTALRVHGPAGQRLEQGRPLHGGTQVTGQRDVAVLEDLPAHREGVQDAGRGQVRRGLVADVGAEPGLDLAGDRGLGHHQHGGPHDRTLAKSRAARTVPRTEPDTLERVPSARGW